MAYWELPRGYAEEKSWDIKKDRSLTLYINIVSVALAIAVMFAGLFLAPRETAMLPENRLPNVLAIVGGCFVTVALQGLIRALVLRLATGEATLYFNGLALCAVSEGVFLSLPQYLLCGLVPVLAVCGAVAAANAFVPESWWWTVCFINAFAATRAGKYIYLAFAMPGRGALINEDREIVSAYLPQVQKEEK